MTAITLTLTPLGPLTRDTFYQLCQANPDTKFERSAQGELIIMSPTGGESGRLNADIAIDLGLWNRQTQLGYTFDSSTGFELPNGANRSPDAAWVERRRWDALTPQQRQTFPPIAPDFVIELRSAIDSLAALQEKMREYRDSGVRLGWLLNPQDSQVEIYRPNQPVDVLQSPQLLSGEDVLPGFTLHVSPLMRSPD